MVFAHWPDKARYSPLLALRVCRRARLAFHFENLPCVLAVAASVPFIMKSQYVEEMRNPPSKLVRSLRKSAAIVENNPALLALLKNPKAVAGTIIEEKSRLGIKRLELKDLSRWNEIRERMAKESPALCSGMWTGKGVTRTEVESVLNRFDEATIDDWTSITMRAAVYELDNREFKKPFDEVLATGIRFISTKLQTKESDRFQRLVYGGKGIADEDACWVMGILLQKNKEMEEVLREPFLRALAGL